SFTDSAISLARAARESFMLAMLPPFEPRTAGPSRNRRRRGRLGKRFSWTRKIRSSVWRLEIVMVHNAKLGWRKQCHCLGHDDEPLIPDGCDLLITIEQAHVGGRGFPTVICGAQGAQRHDR